MLDRRDVMRERARQFVAVQDIPIHKEGVGLWIEAGWYPATHMTVTSVVLAGGPFRSGDLFPAEIHLGENREKLRVLVEMTPEDSHGRLRCRIKSRGKQNQRILESFLVDLYLGEKNL